MGITDMKFLKNLFRRKEKIGLQDFAYLMIYPATSWQRDDNFKEIIQDALRDNPDKVNKIYIELTAFQYWLQCFIIKVALKEREDDWKIAVVGFKEVWLRFCLIGDEIQAGNDLIRREFPNMQISHKEYAQILSDKKKDYDKAFSQKRAQREGKSWPLEQVATDLCQNLYMGKDSKIIASLVVMISSSIKHQTQALKELKEKYNLSLWEK